MKKILICVSIIFFAFTGISQAVFVNVSANHQYKTAIDYVQAQGIVSGYSDGTYRPDSNITSDELQLCLIRFGYRQDGGGEYSEDDIIKDVFTDVKQIAIPSVNKFIDYICLAKEKNIISGYSDGTFRPDADITVGEASKIISNSFGLTTESTIQVDAENKFKPYIDALAEKKAYPVQISSQGAALTRGQMAEIIYRLKNNITNLESVTYEDIV